MTIDPTNSRIIIERIALVLNKYKYSALNVCFFVWLDDDDEYIYWYRARWPSIQCSKKLKLKHIANNPQFEYNGERASNQHVYEEHQSSAQIIELYLGRCVVHLCYTTSATIWFARVFSQNFEPNKYLVYTQTYVRHVVWVFAGRLTDLLKFIARLVLCQFRCVDLCTALGPANILYIYIYNIKSRNCIDIILCKTIHHDINVRRMQCMGWMQPLFSVSIFFSILLSCLQKYKECKNLSVEKESRSESRLFIRSSFFWRVGGNFILLGEDVATPEQSKQIASQRSLPGFVLTAVRAREYIYIYIYISYCRMIKGGYYYKKRCFKKIDDLHYKWV